MQYKPCPNGEINLPAHFPIVADAKTALIRKHKRLCDYVATFRAMINFTKQRGANTHDEIWCLQHPPVYTLGLNGNHEHILDAGDIPVIKTDRGGQVTFHCPGQLIVYLLIDLQRKKISVKKFVRLLENSVIDMLEEAGVDAKRVSGAPGVYVGENKIAALGIRVKKGCSYHGLALNVDMDTIPFKGINPCGRTDFGVTQLKNINVNINMHQATEHLLHFLLQYLEYDHTIYQRKS